jgi:hypothetical protein
LSLFSCILFKFENRFQKTTESHGMILVENPQSETRWYCKYFLGKC